MLCVVCVVVLLCLCNRLVVVDQGVAQALGFEHALARQPTLRTRVAEKELRARHTHCSFCCLVVSRDGSTMCHGRKASIGRPARLATFARRAHDMHLACEEEWLWNVR